MNLGIHSNCIGESAMQLNSQGLFDILISECNNPYGFHEQIIPTPTATTTNHRNTNMIEEIGHALQVS